MNRRLVIATLATSVAALATAPAALAGPGALDSSFAGGVVPVSGQLFGVAIQSNGEVVAAGQSGGRVFVQRFTTGGASDGAYTGPSGYARAVAVESNGDIVVAGSSGGAMFVERLTPSLTPDSSFGSGGIATTAPGSSAVANAVAVGPDGSIAAVGSVNPPSTEVAAARFSPSGGIDFSEALNFGLFSLASGVAVQPADGKLVIVGQQRPSQVTNGIVGRLNTNGGLDGSFAGTGVETYNFPNAGYNGLNSVALQNNGQIVVGGVALSSTAEALFLRYNSNGSLDSGFGSGGAAAVPASTGLLENPIGAYGVGIAGGGRIVGAGSFNNAGVELDAGLWAVSSAGVVDTGFGSGGTTRGPSGGFEACALAVAPDGGIVTVGNSASATDATPCAANGSGSGYAARYIGDGPPPPPLPPGAAPAVTTGAASGVSEVSATIAGTVNPNNLSTNYLFQYGTSTSYGSTSPSADAGSGDTETSVSATVAGLMPGTTYHYRLQATNADGTTNGPDATFVTSTGTPSLTAGGASRVSEVAATIAGRISPGGLSTRYHFDYGTTTKYGSRTATATVSGGATVGVSARLTGLRPATTYHYRLVAANADGPALGPDRTFTTLPRLHAKLSGLPGSGQISGLATNGLKINVSCSQGCSISASLVINGGTARKLGLGRRSITIAKASGKLSRAGTSHVHLKLSRKGKQYVSRFSGLAVTLSVSARPAGGGPTAKTSKSLSA